MFTKIATPFHLHPMFGSQRLYDPEHMKGLLSATEQKKFADLWSVSVITSSEKRLARKGWSLVENVWETPMNAHEQ